jgi:hypothetical protein
MLLAGPGFGLGPCAHTFPFHRMIIVFSPAAPIVMAWSLSSAFRWQEPNIKRLLVGTLA